MSIPFTNKITKTQIVVGSMRFHRDTGKLIGKDVWNAGKIEIPTEEDRQRIKREKLVRELKVMMSVIAEKTNKFTDDEIEMLFPIVSNIYRRVK